MPRKCVSGADYPVNYRGEKIRLAQITTIRLSDGQPVNHYFAAKETDYAGEHYLPWLVMDQAIHLYRSLQVDAGAIKLQNTDGQLEAMITAERWEGAAVRILDYFTGLGEGLTDAVELIRGVLSNRQADYTTMAWDIVPSWDPGTLEGPPRNYSRTCTWRFKSNQCGYTTGGETTCDKTLATCTLRGRAHRFNGFLQVNATLEKVYTPRPAPTSPRRRGNPDFET
jgi:hypothetical protein